MPQIISIGEALVEVMRAKADSPLDEPGLFEGPFASGAPAIFAVAAARLGLHTGFISCVGDDAFGRLLWQRLQAENVDARLLQNTPSHTTGIAFIAYTADGSREFVFHLRQSAAAVIVEEALDSAYFDGVAWLHISGSSLFLSEASRAACARALELTRAAGGKLSLDPNLRPELMSLLRSRDLLAPYLETADLLLPTAEEARALTGTDDDSAAAAALLGDSDRIVVFKRGPGGATIFSRGGRLDVPGFPVTEVDPTGAGDCFNAAFVYGLHAGWPVSKTASFAAAAGALAVTRLGPMEGAPTVQQIQGMLSRNL